MNPPAPPQTDTPTGACTHRCPRDTRRVLFDVADAGAADVSTAAARARGAYDAWRHSGADERRTLVGAIRDAIRRDGETLTELLVEHIGKPITAARRELAYAADLLRLAAAHETPAEREVSPGVTHRRVPIGVVGMITPWNNPVAVPLGKIGAALRFGDAAVWKPSPFAARITDRVVALVRDAGCPEGLVEVVHGGAATAQRVARADDVDAATITGSVAAGETIAAICRARHIPAQGELGGNNAAIVWRDADLDDAAPRIARAAFGFAGQRCTANRRVVVDAACADTLIERLIEHTARLAWGDPRDDTTNVGPLISTDKAREVADAIDDARRQGCAAIVPHDASHPPDAHGAYHPPTIVRCDSADAAIVQRETFGPVLVVQTARGFDHALRLLNGVPHGLVASLFSASRERHERFLSEAQAGMLKLNQATAGAGAAAPFGGWKASGLGPFEHGPADLEFYTRRQSVYRRADGGAT